MITDIHTHIYNDKTYRDYFAKAKNRISKALVMFWYKFNLDELLKFAETKSNLYIVGAVDIDGDIKKQVKIHQRLFRKKKIYGIKLYPGYQYFYPSDKKIYPIAKLCQKHSKPLIFHSGDVYNPEGDAILKYSHPIYIDELAVKFPKCKIIISHFGFPYHIETANVVSKNENVYTDISGTLEKTNSGKETENMLKQYVQDLIKVFNYFPNVKSKTMFGTDFGGEGTPLTLIDPYIQVVNRLFSKKERENVFYRLAEKLFFE